ncbi:MAG: DEAD/DEAH box helicase, partial [Actinomyces sp.]|nr:DEAD/DEAH box helicase [Actinomyces sp.]
MPIDRRDRLSVDEGEAERALLGEVCDMLTGLAGAVEGRAGSAETPSRKGRPDRPGSAGRPGTPGHPMRPLQDALLQGADVVRLMAEVCPALEARGVEVRQENLPELRDGGVPSVQMEVRAEGADWLDLEVRVEVADVEVPMAALVRALTLGEELLFLPDGTFAHLDDPALDHLRRLLEEAAGLSDQRRSSLRVPRVRLSWWEELLQLGVVQAGEHAWFQTVHDAVAHPPEPATVPAGLRATLRSYQVEGFQWLARLRRSGLGGVLADDMGLGKTVQVLAMVLDEREHPGAALVGGGAAAPATPPGADGDRAPWLVVAPTSVVANWVAEAQRFAPDLHVVAIEATAARRGLDLAEAVRGADVVVTSYALLRLEEQDYADLGVRAVVLDEAQNAKNHTSRTFAAVKKVGASQVFAITGTPMENHLGELWSMFALTAPGLLGTPQQFSQTFRRPLEHGEDAGGELLSRLRRRIAPFLLRRTKEDVALDLPPKQEQVLDVELAPAHRHVYDRLLQKERQRVLGLAEDLEHHQVEVLAALTRLRQLAIDPSLVDEGATAPSSKMEVLLPLLGRAAEEGHRVLVFSQFTRYLRRIAQRLEKAGIAYSYLDGTTPRRAQVIRGFAEGDDPVFLISLKAGGVGVNLAMADYAVLVDPWWNPAAEAQAVDRAHRIGQTRPVHVYRLVARDTIEEKVLALQQRKRDLAEGVLAGGADEVDVGELGAGEAGEVGEA